MKFTPCDTNENIDLVCLVSESGDWEVGIRRVIYGRRVSLSDANGGCYAVDICIGKDEILAIQTLARLVMLLEAVPDDLGDGHRWGQRFPRQERRPLVRGDEFYMWLYTDS